MFDHARHLMGALAIGAAVATTPLAVTPVAAATLDSVEAQQAGLVNVSVIDITTGQCVALCNTAVTLPVAANVEAQVCGVAAQVGVLAQQLQRGGTATCTNSATNQQFSATRN